MQQGIEASINLLFSCCYCFCCCFAALFHRLGSTGNGSGSGNVNSKLRIKLASNYAFNKPPIPPTPFAAPPKRKHLHPLPLLLLTSQSLSQLLLNCKWWQQIAHTPRGQLYKCKLNCNYC